MIRNVLTVLCSGWCAAAIWAQEQPLPQAMPGPASPPADVKPTAPTDAKPAPPAAAPDGVYHDTGWSQECEPAAMECCPTRLGLMRRMFGGWNRSRPVCAEPQGCSGAVCPSDGGWCPIITTYDHSRGRHHRQGREAECGEPRCREPRCRVRRDREPRCRALVAAMLSRVRDRCRVPREHPVLSRVRAWLAGGRCGVLPQECMATPYQTPLRYYFNGETEPAINCATGCGGGDCGNAVCGPGGCGPGGCGPAGFGAGYPVGMAGGGLIGRVAGRGNGHGGLLGCRSREQCPGLAGSHFEGQLRFARDEKPYAPPVNTSDSRFQESGAREMYMKQPPQPQPQATVQQAGYQSPKR